MILLAISAPMMIPGEAGIINSLFRAGLVCLHLRKPESNETALRELLSEINPEFRERLSIHQQHHLASEFGIKRLHYTESSRRSATESTLSEQSEKGYILSTSIHDLAELISLPSLFNYTFFGPVFDSISKKGYNSTVPDGFFLKPEHKKIKVIGLGGITVKNLKTIKQMNFDGGAVLGVLWNIPENATPILKELLDETQALNRNQSSGHV